MGAQNEEKRTKTQHKQQAANIAGGSKRQWQRQTIHQFRQMI